MKLSLAWIFDHIDADWKTQDVDHIITQFNKTTAEIDASYRVAYDLSQFFMGIVTKFGPDGVTLNISELNTQATLPARSDASANACFLIKKEGDRFVWASLAEFGVEKDGLLPALDATEAECKGAWRKAFEYEDVILEVDNKSITHRPDMWGHRGFAREIAAYLNLPLRPAQDFVKPCRLVPFEHTSKATQVTPFVIENKAPQACSRFTGLFINQIQNRPSNLFIASRLLKVGSRPINALVDLTNYVTQDWSQPVHAYDAEKIAEKHVVIRMAKEGEKLGLLDGNEIELTAHDMVIADAKKALCLAGVMGGENSAISATTKSIFFEAATFDAGHVRKMAQRHKTRTESSARFEKTLDPMQAHQTTERFLKLLETSGLQATYESEIIVVGKDVAPLTIEVTHEFLEQRSGVTLSSDEVINLLSRLEFHVLKSQTENKKTTYLVTVPSFRASKDIKIKEDILEEVVRSYGFERIPLELPRILRTPFDSTPFDRLQKAKYFLSHGVGMIEQQNYSLYDDQYLAQLGFAPETAVTLLNPISEHFSRMITSLVPGLLRNIINNHIHHDALSFFECARVWKKIKNEPVEQKSFAGIFFKKRATVDFYECKNHIEDLFKTLGFDPALLAWKKMDQQSLPWYRPFQTASITYNGTAVGMAGIADERFLSKLDIDAVCQAFIFELDGDFLLTQQAAAMHYKSISKYQDTYFDISLFVPPTLEVATLKNNIAKTSALITSVHLIDFFEKQAEATTSRSLTFRAWLEDTEKTLEKTDIDAVWKQVSAAVENLGAKVRM